MQEVEKHGCEWQSGCSKMNVCYKKTVNALVQFPVFCVATLSFYATSELLPEGQEGHNVHNVEQR